MKKKIIPFPGNTKSNAPSFHEDSCFMEDEAFLFAPEEKENFEAVRDFFYEMDSYLDEQGLGEEPNDLFDSDIPGDEEEDEDLFLLQFVKAFTSDLKWIPFNERPIWKRRLMEILTHETPEYMVDAFFTQWEARLDQAVEEAEEAEEIERNKKSQTKKTSKKIKK